MCWKDAWFISIDPEGICTYNFLVSAQQLHLCWSRRPSASALHFLWSGCGKKYKTSCTTEGGCRSLSWRFRTLGWLIPLALHVYWLKHMHSLNASLFVFSINHWRCLWVGFISSNCRCLCVSRAEVAIDIAWHCDEICQMCGVTCAIMPMHRSEPVRRNRPSLYFCCLLITG